MIAEHTRQAARKHLRGCDPVMRQIIDEVGPFARQLESDRYASLVRSIISQQISVGAARSIRARLEQLLSPAVICPESLLGLTLAQLRTAGVSPQKATYLLDLAGKAQDGTVELRAIGRRGKRREP